jgi:hypothetical protein
MSKEFTSALLWLLAAGSMFFLPCCLVLLLDLYPGSTYANHLTSVAQLVAAAIFLVLRPQPAQVWSATMPQEHKSQLRYALRSGVLPLASLFSDWSGELAQQGRAHSLALRVLPTGTAVVILFEAYGIFRDPAGQLFFLSCAVASATFAVAAFAFLAVRLKNIYALEDKLHHQIRLLSAHH